MVAFMEPTYAFELLIGPRPPILIDVRRPDVVERSGRVFPGASFLADQQDGAWLASAMPAGRDVLVACAFGHNRSQLLAWDLAAAGVNASVLAGGEEAWRAAGLPMARRQPARPGLAITLGAGPTRWVTRREPKIDRIACPWLIRRFLDADARLAFVDPEWVLTIAEQTGAIAYDLPGAPLEHDGPLATFDTMLRAFELDNDPALLEVATIVRGADTARSDLHPASAGLLAISLGLSRRHGDDDHAMISEAFTLYDGLYAWARHAREKTHNWPKSAKGETEGAAA